MSAVAAPLAACVTGAVLAPRGTYRAGSVSVNLPRDWSDLTGMMAKHAPGLHYLSVNGPLLDRLFIATLEPGESIMEPRDKDTPRPTFRADMTDTELVEFVVDSLAQAYEAPQSQALRPQNLGSVPGVRFDIATRTSDGLLFSGTALVARANGKFNGLIFLAPSEHYYAAMLPDVEALFSSAQLT